MFKNKKKNSPVFFQTQNILHMVLASVFDYIKPLVTPDMYILVVYKPSSKTYQSAEYRLYTDIFKK